jgi:hypothetical protein
MKTYLDLVNFADKQPKEKSSNWEFEKIERVLDLPYGFLSEVEQEFEQIEEAIVISTNVGGASSYRAYHVSVFYFNSFPFAIYSWGGRRSSDFEEVLVVNKEVQTKAKQYALGLLPESDTEEVDLNSYIKPGYAGKYVWEFLSLEQKPDFYKASMAEPWVFKEKEFSFQGYGYTPSEAQKDLEEAVDHFNNKFNLEIQVGEIVFQEL